MMIYLKSNTEIKIIVGQNIDIFCVFFFFDGHLSQHGLRRVLQLEKFRTKK